MPTAISRALALAAWQGLAPSSQRSYASIWKRWKRFRGGMGFGPIAVGSDPADALIPGFFLHCANQGLSAASIRTFTPAIRFHHALAGRTFDAHPLAPYVLRGAARRSTSTPTVRRPLTVPLLEAVFDTARTPDEVAVAGLAALLFFTGARRADAIPLTAVTFDPAAHLVRDDATINEDGSVTILFRCSKTDQLRRGARVRLDAVPTATVCPVRAVLRQIAHAPNRHGTAPLFQSSDGKAIGAGPVLKAIQAAARAAQQDPKGFTMHSARIGLANALLAAGFSEEFTCARGRWTARSTSMLGYRRAEALRGGHTAAKPDPNRVVATLIAHAAGQTTHV